MGWTTSPSWRCAADVVQALQDEWSIVDAKKTGSAFHALVQNGDGTRSIVQFLLSGSRSEWGYKPVPEEAGPVRCDCPPSLLRLASPPRNERAAQWRQKCEADAGRRSAKRALARALRIGHRVQLVDAYGALVLRVVQTRPLVGEVASGQRYRLRPSAIASILGDDLSLSPLA